MKVRYTVPAQADLDDIYRYISETNSFAADRIKRQIKADADLLGDFPFISRESESPEVPVFDLLFDRR
jgi:plasmid stabilization system protein ParE